MKKTIDLLTIPKIVLVVCSFFWFGPVVGTMMCFMTLTFRVTYTK